MQPADEKLNMQFPCVTLLHVHFLKICSNNSLMVASICNKFACGKHYEYRYGKQVWQGQWLFLAAMSHLIILIFRPNDSLISNGI